MTFPAEEVEGKGGELGHELSWRDQMLSLRRHHSDWGEEKEREVGKENQENVFCSLPQEARGFYPRTSGTCLLEDLPRAWGHPKLPC